jgi:hypothetical protein
MIAQLKDERFTNKEEETTDQNAHRRVFMACGECMDEII